MHLYFAEWRTTWVSNNIPATNWSACASSADGTMLVAVANGGAIYLSTNSGTVWTQSTNAPSFYWNCVASSADGTKLTAVDTGGGWPVYLSTNSGATWTKTDAPTTNSWQSVACSADGKRLVAVVRGGGIWTAQLTPAPQISISPPDGTVALAWLAPSTNFVLQSSADLSTWMDVTNQAVLNLTNLQDEVSLPVTVSDGFFRLSTSP